MDSNFASQLFDLVLQPVGIVGIIIGLVLVIQAQRSRPLAWTLFSLCCFSASLAKFRDKFISEPPPLIFPLQQLRDAGRPLTIILLCLLVLLTLTRHESWRRNILATPVKYLVIVQLAILLKALSGGSIEFAILSVVTFGLVVYVVVAGPARWVDSEQGFRYAAAAIAGVGLIFIGLNGYQAMIDIYPITFSHGRLLGTTGNSQHAAVLLSATIPCFLFLIENERKNTIRLLKLSVLSLVGIALLMTGSRTGICMAFTTILFFYRNKGKSFLTTAFLLMLISALAVVLLGQDGAILGADQTRVSARLLSTENTRQLVWKALWRAFSENPLFGIPVRGDRLGYGESSWLAAGASLGLVGFLPLLLFGIECLKVMKQLATVGRIQPQYSAHCNAVMSGLGCLLVGSFFESFLLGNLSFALFALLTYLSLGQYLLEVQKVREAYYLHSQMPAIAAH